MLIRVVLGILVAVLCAAAPAAAAAAPFTPTVVNGDERGATIRFDVDGNAIDAHDGEIRRFGDRYYLYGTSYGCGYEWQRPGSPFCGFRSYSSPDLEHWTDEGPLFDAGGPLWQTRCNGSTYGCYRPHVAYNAQTERYVLWVNTYDVPQGFHVFESEQPTGPFVERAIPELAVNGDVPPGVNNGDHDVFEDEDGTAYLVHTDWRRGGDIVVEQLDDSWLTGTGRHVRLGITSTEAPSLFRRGDRYYLTLSDPNCGYCTTGTSYFTAESPLGPWRGRSVPDSWRVEGGELLVEGGDFGLSRAGAEWTDYDLRFDATPLATADGGAYAQVGWLFRSSTPGTGYAWLLGNYPHPGAEDGNLTKVVFRGGGVVSATVVDLPFAIEPGREYAIETRLRGDRIVTLIDGTVVDETVDATYAKGRIGFRESNGDGESARIDDVRVTAPDGTVLLQDAFDGDLAAWDRPPARQRGVLISETSCGGQPADVAMLPARDGLVYLFQSDRWNNAAPNEALATHYWEPLRFTDDGEILPLRCGAEYELPLAGATPGHDNAPENLDQTSGDEGFRAHADISRGIARAQTFTADRTGRLTRVAYTTHQVGKPTGPLHLRVTELGEDGSPGRVLAERTLAPDETSWAPREEAVAAGVPVRRGQRYAIVVSAADAAQGAYGLSYSDDDPYAGGEALFSRDGGATWTAEPGRDLKFETSVRQAPAVEASANPASGTAPLAVQLSAAGNDEEGGQLQYAWDFGDGSSGSGASAAHTYTQPGSYTATVTVRDADGATATDSVQIVVTTRAGNPPGGNPPGGNPPGGNPPGGDPPGGGDDGPDGRDTREFAVRELERMGVKKFARRGISAHIVAEGAMRGTVRLRIDKAAARRLNIRRTLKSRSVVLRRAQTKRVKLEPSRKVMRKLYRYDRPVVLTVKVRLKAGSDPARTVVRRVALRR